MAGKALVSPAAPAFRSAPAHLGLAPRLWDPQQVSPPAAGQGGEPRGWLVPLALGESGLTVDGAAPPPTPTPAPAARPAGPSHSAPAGISAPGARGSAARRVDAAGAWALSARAPRPGLLAPARGAECAGRPHREVELGPAVGEGRGEGRRRRAESSGSGKVSGEPAPRPRGEGGRAARTHLRARQSLPGAPSAPPRAPHSELGTGRPRAPWRRARCARAAASRSHRRRPRGRGRWELSARRGKRKRLTVASPRDDQTGETLTSRGSHVLSLPHHKGSAQEQASLETAGEELEILRETGTTCQPGT